MAMTQTVMTWEELQPLVAGEIARTIREHPSVRGAIISTVADTFATNENVQAILEHLDVLREDFNRRMAQSERRMDAFERTMQELREDFNRQMAAFAKQQDEFAESVGRVDSHIGALGSRWGLQTEGAFRSGLLGILQPRLGLQVERFWRMDPEGIVFGQPDQVEIDVVVHNDTHWLMEIKSSMSKGDVYIFEKKVAFYEKVMKKTVERRIIISPMLGDDAKKVAEALGMEVYTSAYDVAG